MSSIEELEKKNEERLAARAEAEAAQYAVDLEAKFALEDEHGALATVKISRFVAGQPTRAFIRMPKGVEYKRYVDQIGKAVEKKNTQAQRAAQELLATAAWVYPTTDEARKAMLEAFPGLLTSLGIAAAALAEGKAEDEGKG